MSQKKQQSSKTYDCGILGELNREELILLAKMVLVGNFIIQQDDKQTEIKLLQKIEDKVWNAVRTNQVVGEDWFEKAKLLSKQDITELSEITGRTKNELADSLKDRDEYYLSDTKFNKIVKDYIEPHDEENFWYILTSDLAKRDMAEDKIKKLPDDIYKRFELIDRYENKYHSEFAKYGVKRLKIVK